MHSLLLASSYRVPSAGLLGGAGLLALLLWASRLEAGEITALNWYSGVASVAGEIIVAPSAPNNDDVFGPSPNTIFITQKHYTGIGPVDLVFTVIPTGGTTEYAFIEGVSNSTGIDWSGYRLELGYGIGAGFTPALPGDPLDFDAPDFNSPFAVPAFSTLSISANEVVASDGVIPNTAFLGGIVFHVDVPDGITEFTIRQSPIPIPMPGCAAILVAGSLIESSRRRRGMSCPSTGSIHPAR